MKVLVGALAILTLAATEAPAQGVNLTGRYVCIQMCRSGAPGQPAFVTQYGWDLNLVMDTGEPARAWVDWPGHIWIGAWNQGAIYSPDGMVIHFDGGTIWQREVEPPPAVAKPRR
jgi:hypothetical protein